MKRIGLSILILISIVCYSVINAEESLNKDYDSIKMLFAKYTTSFQAADLNGMLLTVSVDSYISFLTPSGKLIEGLEGYKKYYEEWFGESGWKIKFGTPEFFMSDNSAYSRSKFIYRDKPENGAVKVLESWSTLIYRKREGGWKITAGICTPISKTVVSTDSGIEYSDKQDYFFEILKNRRTIRKFKPDPIPQEHIMKIIEAAHLAPTSGNQQPWKFVVVQDRKKIDRLKESVVKWIEKQIRERYHLVESEIAEKVRKYEPVIAGNLSAPVLIVILVDSKAQYPDYIHTDGDLAAENLMLAARALGYGTGYYTSFYPEEIIKPFFNIPDNYRLICVTPIGIPESWPPMPDKEELNDIIINESF